MYFTTDTITIASIDTRKVDTRYGEKPVYTIVSDTGVKYECGFKKPAHKTGDVIEVAYLVDAYGNKVNDTKKVHGGALSASPASVSSSAPKKEYSPAGSQRAFPVPPLHGDRSIIRQNALAHAVKVVEVSIQHSKVEDFCDPSDSAIYRPVLENAGMLAEYVIEIAKRFEAYSSGADVLEKVEKKMREQNAAE